ncbi:MAG TPA: DUF6551 family protein [Acidothermaceae bacterium]
MTNPKSSNRLEQEKHLKWVPLVKMRVSEVAQRDFRQYRADHLAADMDLEQLGNPTVNERDGHFFVMDGQHRVAAYKQWIGDSWITQELQCWAYVGLTEQEEAEYFLKLNDTLGVKAMEKFRVSVRAGREIETDIDRIVRAQGLHIASDKNEGSVGAVGTLRRVYSRSGAGVLARTLGIIRDAYGTPGLDAPVIEGIGYLCGRYNGQLDASVAVQKLGGVQGGVNGLLGLAEQQRARTRAPRGQCVAAAAVDIINRGRGTKKLPSWWADDTQ